MKEEKEIQHVITFSVSEIEESPIGPARYIRTFTVRSLLGQELVIRLRSESRLGLTLEHESEKLVMSKQRLRHRREDGNGKPEA